MPPRDAAAQLQTHDDFRLLHHALAVFLAIRGMAAAIAHDVHIVQMHLNTLGLQTVNARVTDRGKYPSKIRIGSEKRGLDQR